MYYENIEGWFDFNNIYDRAIAQVNENATFVEIGAWKGKSTVYMAEQIIKSGKNIHFFVIDTFEGDDGGEYNDDIDIINNTLYETYLKNIEPVKHRIITYKENSKDAHKRFNDKSIDFLFIDGDHSYEGVKSDLENWFAKVATGGTIAGHDYNVSRYGVKRAVDEFFGWMGGVKQDGSSWTYFQKINDMKYNARVISVNTRDPEILKTLDGRSINDTYHARREYIEDIVKNFNNEYFNLSIFDAITPREFKLIHYENEREHMKYNVMLDQINLKRMWSVYAIANFLSHLEIWKMEEDTLIFEDDVEWDKINWKVIYETIEKFKKIKTKKKLLYLQRTVPWTMKPRKVMGAGYNDDFMVPLVSTDLSGTAAYFLDTEGKEIILKQTIKYHNTDNYLHDIYKLKEIYYFWPLDKNALIDLSRKLAWAE